MKLVDVASRNQAESAAILKKITAYVKTLTCNTGEIRMSEEKGVYWVEVENDGRVSKDLVSIVEKSKTARVVGSQENDGEYWWKSNTYIRPVSIVQFKF